MNTVLAGRTAQSFLDTVLDEGSFTRWDNAISADQRVTADYNDAMIQARARSGLDEAVITGAGTIRGRRVAIVASEFAFLAGSIGVITAERLVRAVERATA